MPSTRRRLLAGAGTAAVAFAGCTAVRRSRLGDALREPPERRVAPDWRPGPGTWADGGYGPANTRHNPHASPPRSPPDVVWRQDLPGPPNSLVVAEGRVYCSTPEGLVAFDAATGERRWERPTDAAAVLAYVDGRLYATNTDEEVAALTPGGTERWRTAVAAEALKDLHEQDGYVFLGTFSGHRVLHADTGDVVRARDATWEFLASAGGAVYTTGGGAPGTPVTYGVDGRDLAERWDVGTACSVGRPVVDAGRVYYPVDPTNSAGCPGRRRLWAHDLSGARLWTATVEGATRYPAVDGHRVFVPTAAEGSDGGRLVSLGVDGTPRWTHRVPGSIRDPTVADGAVYAGPSGNDRTPLVALDAPTGERLWERPVSRDVRIAAAGGTLYVGDGDGLRALRD